MPAATVADVATSLGRPLSDSETAQVEMWLGDAERQIKARLGDPLKLDQDVLAYVEREAVVLKVKRPDPAQRVEITVDDGRIARAYDRDTGQITILPEWWELLAPGAQSEAFSTRPGFEPDCGPGAWL